MKTSGVLRCFFDYESKEQLSTRRFSGAEKFTTKIGSAEAADAAENRQKQLERAIADAAMSVNEVGIGREDAGGQLWRDRLGAAVGQASWACRIDQSALPDFQNPPAVY